MLKRDRNYRFTVGENNKKIVLEICGNITDISKDNMLYRLVLIFKESNRMTTDEVKKMVCDMVLYSANSWLDMIFNVDVVVEEFDISKMDNDIQCKYYKFYDEEYIVLVNNKDGFSSYIVTSFVSDGGTGRFRHLFQHCPHGNVCCFDFCYSDKYSTTSNNNRVNMKSLYTLKQVIPTGLNEISLIPVLNVLQEVSDEAELEQKIEALFH